MKINHLMEGAEPKLPGAPKGVKIMTPQQFVAASQENPQEELDENLRKWFKEKWVRFGPDGKIRGDCARGDDSEGKPKCLPQSKAHSLGKKGRASAAARKRREDPNPERRGPAKNVATKKKSNEGVVEAINPDITNPAFSHQQQIGDYLYVARYWGRRKNPIGLKITAYHGNKLIGRADLMYHSAPFDDFADPETTPNRMWLESEITEVNPKYQRQGIMSTMYAYARMLGNTVKPSQTRSDDAKAAWASWRQSGDKEHLTKMRAEGVAEDQLDELKCWPGYTRVQGVPAGAPGSCKKKTNESEHKCPHCGGEMVSEELMNEKKDACYYKVKSRYKVWPSAYASGALVKCRKKGAKNWGNKSESVEEATKLPAQTRELKGKELEDYLDRIRGQEKLKTDKYKLPYIHRSSVMGYYSPEGKKYNTDAIKTALSERPKSLLKKNEKMKHSDGELEQFFNIGFAALVGIALDENTNELVVVDTCPGAGSCKVDCFAMKGGKIQFQGPWLSDGRILTYLLNDPEGFFAQLKAEIQKEEMKGKKGGYRVSIRWHDAGDFFSPEYAAMAFKLASELPDVQFYAYTKIAGVALGQKPDNFIINWSEGAHTSQEKQVKAADPNLERTKNSRIVPSNLFYDLLVKDEKKNLVKGPEGQWQVIPDKLPELKQRLAKQYGISANSILSYDEWDAKTQGGKKETPIKYNVIITPGEPDVTAKSHGVLSTLLLKH